MNKYKCPVCHKHISRCDTCEKRFRLNRELYCVNEKHHYCYIRCLRTGENISVCKIDYSQKRLFSSTDNRRIQSVSHVLGNV